MNFLLARLTTGSEGSGYSLDMPESGMDAGATEETKDDLDCATPSRAVAADTSWEASPVVVALLHFGGDDLNEKTLFFSVVPVPPLYPRS